MLNITRKDGATFTDAQDSLRKLWEENYANRYDDVDLADGFAVQFQDGTISVVGWYDDQPCEPIELRPEEYTVTLGDSISRSEVRRVLEYHYNLNVEQLNKTPNNRQFLCENLEARINEDDLLAREFGIDLSQKGAEG